MYQAADIKFRRGEAALAVAGKGSVDPEEEGGLHAFKCNVNFLLQIFRCEHKAPQIRTHRVFLGHLSSLQRLQTIPGVHGVDVLGCAVALELHIGGHFNRTEGAAFRVHGPKVRRGRSQGGRVLEFPNAIEGALYVVIVFLTCTGKAGIKSKISMGI